MERSEIDTSGMSLKRSSAEAFWDEDGTKPFPIHTKEDGSVWVLDPDPLNLFKERTGRAFCRLKADDGPPLLLKQDLDGLELAALLSELLARRGEHVPLRLCNEGPV